jgi:DNA polymerase III sliding clamp (beta) subunit (PCNA family)
MNNPFVLLPANLGGLAKLTADEMTRYSMCGVLVRLKGNGYEVVATDGRKLAIISGRATADPLEFPTLPELAEVPPAVEQGVIPTQAWRDAFRSLPRGKTVASEPVLGHVAVHLGAEESILATTDGEESHVQKVPNVERQFPDYNAVLPRDEPRGRVVLNPSLLLEVIKLARDFVAGTENPMITLEVRDPNVPIQIRASNGDQELLAILMPMTPVT